MTSLALFYDLKNVRNAMKRWAHLTGQGKKQETEVGAMMLTSGLIFLSCCLVERTIIQQ